LEKSEYQNLGSDVGQHTNTRATIGEAQRRDWPCATPTRTVGQTFEDGTQEGWKSYSGCLRDSCNAGRVSCKQDAEEMEVQVKMQKQQLREGGAGWFRKGRGWGVLGADAMVRKRLEQIGKGREAGGGRAACGFGKKLGKLWTSCALIFLGRRRGGKEAEQVENWTTEKKVKASEGVGWLAGFAGRARAGMMGYGIRGDRD
jgi:hypothetical protein